MFYMLKFLVFLVTFFSIIPLFASQSIQVWHGLGGELGNHFQVIVDAFNKKLEERSSPFKITLQWKGSYDEVVKAYLETPAAGRPDIVQAYEMATRLMLDTKNPQGRAVYIPLYKVMEVAKVKFDENNFIPQILLFYRAGEKRLASLPFNASTVVLYYNKTALAVVRFKPIETFEEFPLQMVELGAQQQPVGMGAGWLSGHYIDQTGAIHNKQIATFGNGVDSSKARLAFAPFFIFHLKALQGWYRRGWFSLEQGPNVEKEFAEGKIVYLSQGGNRHSDISKMVNGKFEIGVAAFPYWKAYGKPYNTIAGGASFWVANKDQSLERLKVMAEFLQYLASPEVQAQWQRLSGYVPVTKGAHEINVQQGFFDSSELGVQAARIASESFTRGEAMEYSRGILLSHFPDIRKIVIAEMIKAIKDEQTAEEALKTIETEGNKILKIRT
jgi:sn-glycerol 3-phosphate transport system substrate-binding protein